MRILITGGAGCLGINLIEHLLPQGFDICIIDNFATGRREAVPQIEGLSVVEGSIADAQLVQQTFNTFKPTHVIHSAASYKNPQDWLEDTATNVAGTIHIVKSSIALGVKRFINFQTALCYGRPTQLPIPVFHPTAPFTSYGISKTAGEAYILQSGLSVVSLRLANICCPRLAIGPIPTFYQRLKSGQDCFCSDTVRDFLDISDFFSLMDIVIAEDAPCGIFNVSSGKGHSIKDVYDTIASYLSISNTDVPIVPAGDDDVPSVVLDPKETKNLLNWESKTSFQDTIHLQLKWYDIHGVSDTYSHLSQPDTKIKQ